MSSGRTLAWVQQPTRVRLPAAISPPPVVEVRLGSAPDPRIIDGEVQLVIDQGPPGATLRGNVARCPGGVATFDNLRPSTPGAYVLRAECDEASLVFKTRPSAYRYTGLVGLAPGQQVTITGNGSTTGVVQEVGDGFVVIRDDSETTQQSVVAGSTSAAVNGVGAIDWFAADAPGIDRTDAVLWVASDGEGIKNLANPDWPAFRAFADWQATDPLPDTELILDAPTPVGAVGYRQAQAGFISTIPPEIWGPKGGAITVATLVRPPGGSEATGRLRGFPADGSASFYAQWVTDGGSSPHRPQGFAKTSSSAGSTLRSIPPAGSPVLPNRWALLHTVIQRGAGNTWTCRGYRNGVPYPAGPGASQPAGDLLPAYRWEAGDHLSTTAFIGLFEHAIDDAEALEQARRCGVAP